MAILRKINQAVDQEVRCGTLRLPGHLYIPPEAQGIVIFAHGSGSSRFSRRNMMVANTLQNQAIGTLLFDLLTHEEEKDRANTFDIEMLAERLDDVKMWLQDLPESSGLPFGYFGASTGAGAALVAAANSPENISAVVSRGGRPDLADESLGYVTAPTLLIVGGADDFVVELNRNAFAQLHCRKALEIVPGATHLFPEPGALELVADLAETWFSEHL